MIYKSIILCILTLTLFAKETLYLNFPQPHLHASSHTTFGKELVVLIKNSKKSIFFAIYGLRAQNDILQALINAQKRGVIIKGVVDSDYHNKNYYSDTKLLYKHFKIISDHKSYIMHDKFFVFDKKILWSGSSNISDTGTGGYNANDVLVIEDKRVAKVYINEFNQMFKQKRFHNKKRRFTALHIKTKESDISIFFSPKSKTYKNAIKSLVENAKEYIYIPIFYITHKALAQQLIKAKQRGVDVRVILDATAASNRYSAHRLLRKNNIPVKVENFGGKMHAKSMIIDDKYIISGSMNLTKAGVSKNDENTLVVNNRNLALQYKKYFLRLWRYIPQKYLKYDARAESISSGNSCFDGIDNDFDKKIDKQERLCKN
jgi:phosphatidylserine/phosphatidylglycerophosphate/cardiolipin synthase-like enzyme